jgi:uncharacterized protein (TIGR02145 family)
MKKSLFLMMIAAMAIAFAGCNKDNDESAKTPPLAATNQSWTFGEQTWSDAIHCPECNKEAFERSDTDPDCRSYTENGKTWYYYNWAYVDANKNKMCPSPWRVPIKEDFETLVSTLGGNTQTARDAIAAAWGYGGIVAGSPGYMSTIAVYWSSTEDNRNFIYYFDSDTLGVFNIPDTNLDKYYGLQVRCVKGI